MEDETGKTSSVTLKRVLVFFILLATGIIMAVIILILEIAVYRRKQNKRNTVREVV